MICSHGEVRGGVCECFEGWTSQDEIRDWGDCHVSDAVVEMGHGIIALTLVYLLLRTVHVGIRFAKYLKTPNYRMTQWIHYLLGAGAGSGLIRVLLGAAFNIRHHERNIWGALCTFVAFACFASCAVIRPSAWYKLSLSTTQRIWEEASRGSTRTKGSRRTAAGGAAPAGVGGEKSGKSKQSSRAARPGQQQQQQQQIKKNSTKRSKNRTPFCQSELGVGISLALTWVFSFLAFIGPLCISKNKTVLRQDVYNASLVSVVIVTWIMTIAIGGFSVGVKFRILQSIDNLTSKIRLTTGGLLSRKVGVAAAESAETSTELFQTLESKLQRISRAMKISTLLTLLTTFVWVTVLPLVVLHVFQYHFYVLEIVGLQCVLLWELYENMQLFPSRADDDPQSHDSTYSVSVNDGVSVPNHLARGALLARE